MTRRRDSGQPKQVATIPADTLAQPRRVITGGVVWRTTFAAFRHRNYKLFFGGQALSLVGTWMQTMAESWLVYQLSHSPLALGVIRFLHTVPVTLLSLVGGAVADRIEKRRILLVTQTLSMLFAFVLGFLVFTGVVQIWHVGVIGVCLGIAQAFDIPARQSFVVDMVGKRDLMNAIALNSSMFNGARVFGPALAGLLIGVIGLAGCFFLNGLSFFAVIASYWAMRLPRRKQRAAPPSIREATLEAARYLLGQRLLRAVLVLVGIVSLFGWPYSVLMPAVARDVLGLEAGGYGSLMAANGFGAFVGAITLASLGNYPNKRRLVVGGLFGFSLALSIFAVSAQVVLSAIALAAAGCFMIIFFATANSVIQLRVPDELRGRVMGIYSLCFIGISPLGSLVAGLIAKVASPSFAIGLGAAACFLAGIAAVRLLASPAAAS